MPSHPGRLLVCETHPCDVTLYCVRDGQACTARQVNSLLRLTLHHGSPRLHGTLCACHLHKTTELQRRQQQETVVLQTAC